MDWKINMTPKSFHLELYNITYYFFIGCEPRAYKEYLDVKFDIEVEVTDDDDGATCFDEDTRSVFLWVRKSNDMAATLCHESVHAACYALDWAGVYVDLKEDEALAYLAELVFLKAADKALMD